MQTWHAVLLGLVEGLTEFLPVSSTGHLVLVGHFLGVESTKKTFEILVQLGAILAILSVYAAKLIRILVDLPSDARTRRFVFAVLVAFLPAAVVGVFAHRFIKDVLLMSPLVVCVSLVVGGIILLVVDRMPLRATTCDVMDISLPMALKIGILQCVAMIPGVSRSGATIVGGMLLGADKRTAAEFSFFLAMPTMVGAFSYDLYKSYKFLDADAIQAIVIGFVVAFITGVIVVKYLLDFVSRRGFAPFAWWRIIVGGLGLGALMVLG